MKALDLNTTALVMVDMQERLVPAMSNIDRLCGRMALLLRGAAEVGLDVIVTEQYPKGLGNTLPEFTELLKDGTPVIAKTGFSVLAEPEFCTELVRKQRKTLIFAGIEGHVCVYQSIIDALEAGYRVIVAGDAVASRAAADTEMALAQAGRAGAEIICSEALLFMLLGDAKHPCFKAVSKLVR